MNGELYLKDIMHLVAQSLMVPAMIVLVLLLVFTIFCIGSIIAEIFTERRHFKQNTPRDVNAVHDAPYAGIVDVIEGTGLLKSQKEALVMVARNMGLPDDDLFSLAKAEIARVDGRHQRMVRRTELVTKIGPMMGLICTLIPLGPGIVAMGQGQVDQLSSSLLIAFDGTVAGLVAAVVAMVITSIRKRWYAQYMVAMEALMNSILEKAEQARRSGIELPHGYTGPERAGLPVHPEFAPQTGQTVPAAGVASMAVDDHAQITMRAEG